MKKYYLKSYAKINLALNIVAKREDDYHELDMVMLPLELHDNCIIEKNTARDNFVTIDEYSSEAVKHNTVSAVIEKLKEYGLKDIIKVFIHKVIPMRSGLGGGSSNAAFVLKAINEFCNLNLTKEQLIEIGLSVGADVPFFIDCKPCRAQGLGEILTPITVKNNYCVLIVKPNQGLSTKKVFSLADEINIKCANIEKVIEGLETGNDELICENMGNALETPAISLLPEIDEIKRVLHGFGAKIVQMTGSGSAVFAMSTDLKLLKKIERNLEDKYVVELTKILK